MGMLNRLQIPSPVSEDGRVQPTVNMPQLLGRFTDMAANIETLRRLMEFEEDLDYSRIIDDISNVRPLSGPRTVVEFIPVPAGVMWHVHRVVIALEVSFERGGSSRAQANIYIGTNRDLRNYVGSAQCFFTASTESGTPGIVFEPTHPLVLRENQRLTIEVSSAREEPYVPVIAYAKVIKRAPEIIER